MNFLKLSVLPFILIFPFIAQAATVSLFTDGFEGTPEFDVWTSVDTTKWDVINNAGGAHSGSKRAEVKGANDSDDILAKTISTTGYDNLVLTYWYKAESLETGDEVFLEYTTDGSTWSTLFTFGDGLDDNVWHEKTHNLPASANDNPNFSFRFRANLGQGNDFLKLDDVSLSGEAIEVTPPPPPTTGGIHGWKYEDQDNSGAINGDEPKLGGWTIKLYQGDTLASTTVTAWDGIFNFNGVVPGTYTVCEEMQTSSSGWFQTQPSSGPTCANGTKGYEVTVAAGQDVYSIDFGNIHGGLISGWKYLDENNNGTRDGVFPTDADGEKGVTDWTINLYHSDWELATTTKTFADVGSKGIYNFFNVEPGDYYICEDKGSSDWHQTDPREDGGSTWRAEGRVQCPNGTWGYHTGNVGLGEKQYSYDFGNNGGEVVPLDTEAPHTIITAPGPNSEWEGNILITGTTTDNVGTASTTISFALYSEAEDNDNVGSCGAYTPIITLDNNSHSAVFDWSYSWTPADEGSYCIQSTGLDTAGNVEHTATVFPVKFKKTVTPPTPPVDNNNNHEVSFGGGSGGGSTSGVGTSSLFALGNFNTNNGVGGDTGGVGLVTNLGPIVPLANLDGLDGGIDDGGVITAHEILLGLSTTTGTSTATSSTLAGGSFLAALGGLFNNWWWLIILLILLAGLGGYWYWQKQEENNI
ncbi:MAG: hypothetical protein Q7T49_02570 [bacterium]|nr:hypothetical protein [bacterium]